MLDSQTLLFTGLFIVNIFSFIFVGVDKKKAHLNAERSPEVMFFLFAVIFGSLGVFSGMLFFRHKTRKLYFIFGMTLLLLQQLLLIFLINRLA